MLRNWNRLVSWFFCCLVVFTHTNEGILDMTIQSKFAAFRDSMASWLIERNDEIDITLAAIVAKQNALFVGPPGVAKSMLAEQIASWIGGRFFNIQVNRFTAPEELFGQLSVKSLKNDEFRRIITGKLADCEVAVIDEIFKASSAILNTMLRVLNERRYQNGNEDVACPLQLAIAASNEWPGNQEGGKDLGALFDRFLIRKEVKTIKTSAGLDRLLWSDLQFSPVDKLSIAEIDQANKDAAKIPFAAEAKSAYEQIVKTCRAQGVFPGDRRLRAGVGVCRAVAWIAGNTEVTPEDCGILAHILWDDPQSAGIVAEIVGKIANPSEMEVNTLLIEANEIINKDGNGEDVAAVVSATKKLAAITGKLKKMSGTKADNAVTYVTDETKKLRAMALGSPVA